MSKYPFNRLVLIGFGLYLFCQVLFLVNIQFPRGHCFDEFHYVPSAKQFLSLSENQNYEHPPLGKLLMAVGIGLLGDRPIGWRFMSTVFGSLTLVGMFFWGLALFKNERAAWTVALLTLLNQLLYVQSRIGMLDTFMMAFLAWGLAAFTAAWDPSLKSKQNFRYLAFAGLMLGLATATKWIGIVPWVTCIFLVVSVKILQGWSVVFQKGATWYHARLWNGIKFRGLFLCLVLIPLLAYFSTFLPFFFVRHEPAYTLWDIFQMQVRMWDGQLRVVTDHPYMSYWLKWPLLERPIWYAFDKEGAQGEWVRGVLMLGNPLVMWCGLVAILAAAFKWVQEGARESFLILVFYGALTFCWAVIPRKIAFYYYYYPAGMVLSLAIAAVFEEFDREKFKWASFARWVFVGTAFALFVYFFPILAALKIPAESFRKWMWFSSWI